MTPLQQEVFALVLQGKSNHEIAIALKRQISTVKTHVTNLMKAHKVKSRAQLIAQHYLRVLNESAEQTREAGPVAKSLSGHSRSSSSMEVEAPLGAMGAAAMQEARLQQLDRALELIFKPT